MRGLTLVVSFVYFICFSINGYAQNTGTVEGIIIDTVTNKPVSYANVALKQKENNSIVTGCASNDQGYFELTGLSAGAYYLSSFFMGYEPYTSSLIVIKGNSTISLGRIFLKPSLKQIEKVDIVAERPMIIHEPGKTVLNVADNVSVESETGLDLLRFLPSTSMDEDNKVLVRGTPATILIDGVETDMENPLETLPVGMIEKVELITNPSAKYSTQSGGSIINIVLKKGNVKEIKGKVQLGIGNPKRIESGGNLFLRKGKWTGTSNFSYRRYTDESVSDILRQNILKDSNYCTITGSGDRLTQDFNIRQNLKYAITNNSSLSFDGAYRNYKYSYDNQTETYWHYSDSSVRSHNLNNSSGATNKHYFNAKLVYLNKCTEFNNLQIVLQYERQKNSYPLESTINYFDVDKDSLRKTYYTNCRRLPEDIYSNRMQLDYVHKTGEKSRCEAGFLVLQRNSKMKNDYLKYTHKYLDDQNSYELITDSSYMYQMEADEIIPAAYGLYHIDLHFFTLSAGLRCEYGFISTKSATIDSVCFNMYNNLLPSFTMHKKMNEKVTLDFSLSNRTKLPNYRQLNPVVVYYGNYNKSGGNPDLKPEKITNIELSLRSVLKKHNINLSLFYKDFRNFIGQRYSMVTENGYEVLFKQYDNFGTLNQLGAELNISSRLPKKINVKVSLMAMQQKEYENDAEQTGVDDFIWSGKLTVDQYVNKNLKLMLNANYNSAKKEISSERLGYSFVNLSVLRWFYKKKILVSANFYDVLNTLETERRYYSPEFEQLSESKNISRRFLLSVSYRL